MDYYFFNHQAIDMEALNDPEREISGVVVTLGVYLVGVAVQTPFIDSGFGSGPFVKMLGGIDISWLIGLAPTGGVSCPAQSAVRSGGWGRHQLKGERHAYPGHHCRIATMAAGHYQLLDDGAMLV